MNGRDELWFNGNGAGDRPGGYSATPSPSGPSGNYDSGNPFASPPITPSGGFPPAGQTSGGAGFSGGVGYSGMPLVTRPGTTQAAYIALVVAAAMSLLTAVWVIIGIQDLQGKTTGLLEMDPSGTASLVGNGYVEGVAVGLAVFTVGVAAVFAGVYIVFAWATRTGKQWPRPVGTGLSVISLFGLFGGPTLMVAVVAGIVAVVLLWTSPSRRYCDYVAANRR